MKIIDRLKDKNILIWGYGREGKSTERFIKTYCSVKSLTVFEGSQDEIDETGYDIIIKSPGIRAERYCDNFTSQTELFLEEFASQTVGITGTKGKSTTTCMLCLALQKASGHDAILVGNLGFPCLDHYAEITDNTVIVFEMSCHQLAHLQYSPHIAVFLNLYEDHLDYYGDMGNYFNAKKNITLHQGAGDFFLCGENVPEIDTRARKIIVPFHPEHSFDMKLMGEHNQFNANVVHIICTQLFGCQAEDVSSVLAGFSGLPHRLEHVATVAGVDFYDDSISTIPEATIQAIRSIPNTRTVLIGGMDRNIDYDILIDFMQHNSQYDYILSYKSGQRIYESVRELKNCHYVPDLKEAVGLAAKITPQGCACVLSPAAASYGYFRNFEERGDTFQELVLALQA